MTNPFKSWQFCYAFVAGGLWGFALFAFHLAVYALVAHNDFIGGVETILCLLACAAFLKAGLWCHAEAWKSN